MRWACLLVKVGYYLRLKRVTLPENLVKRINLAWFNNEATLFIVGVYLWDFDLDPVVGFVVETVGVSYNQHFAHILQHRSIEQVIEEFSKGEVGLDKLAVVVVDELFISDAFLDFYLRYQQGLS